MNAVEMGCSFGLGRMRTTGPDGIRRRALVAVLLVVCLLLGALPLQAQWGHWPGWRGDGNGVSEESDLPVEWDETGYEWRTRIDGTGNSSPIVWGEQVFVTTSVESPTVDAFSVGLRWVAVVSGGIVAVSIAMLVIMMLMSRRKARSDDAERKGPVWFRALAGLEAVGVVALTGYFFWSLRALLLYRHMEFTPQEPDVAWILAGETAVLGLIAAVGSLRARSWWRLGGIALLVSAGGLFYVLQPPTVSTAPVPLEWQMNVFRPLAYGTAWLSAMWLVARLIGFPYRRSVSPLAYAVRPASILLIAVAGFAYFNVFEPRLGVRREVWALNVGTGEVLWRSGLSAPSGRKWRTNTYATPTPVTNGAYVVADFGPVLVALDVRGEIVWTRDEPLYMSYLRYGAAASPVIHGDKLIYMYVPENPDTSKGAITGERAYLTALDLASGEEVWRVDGIEGGHDSYGAPLLVPTADGAMSVVVSVFDHAHGYDADTGRHLWSFDLEMAHPVPSHVADERAVYIGGGLYGPQAAAAIDLGGFAAGRGAPGSPPTGQDPLQLKARWSTNRQTPDISSPVAYEGLVYWVTEDGRMFCHDAETGEVVWRERLSGSFTASPVAGDGKVYVQATDGRTIVLKAGREFAVLAENQLTFVRGSNASLAIAGGMIYVRGGDYLYAVRGGRSGETSQ